MACSRKFPHLAYFVAYSSSFHVEQVSLFVGIFFLNCYGIIRISLGFPKVNSLGFIYYCLLTFISHSSFFVGISVFSFCVHQVLLMLLFLECINNYTEIRVILDS
jgi:hypothetical protein